MIGVTLVSMFTHFMFRLGSKSAMIGTSGEAELDSTSPYSQIKSIGDTLGSLPMQAISRVKSKSAKIAIAGDVVIPISQDGEVTVSTGDDLSLYEKKQEI